MHAQIRHRLDVGARSLGLRELKNIRYPVEVFVFESGIALTEILLDDKAAAIVAIDRLLTESSFVSWHFVLLDPAYQPLRAEPAFTAMLERARRHEADPISATATAALR